MKLIIVTGLSGSGKSVAIRQLEDTGYYCIDNLPLSFIIPVAKSLEHAQEYVAFAVDARSDFEGHSPQELLKELNAQKGWDVRILFLTASTQELIQRFSETRRRHPLTLKFSAGKEKVTLAEVIAKERELLEPFSVQAHVVDTTHLQSNTLRTWVKDFADAPHADLSLTFESFGYDPELRPFTGRDPEIVQFMEQQPMVAEMVGDIEHFIEKWLPSYQATNRQYLTIAIGCTGGQHRSVYVAETLAKHFAQKMASVAIRHRIIGQAKKPVKGLSQTL